MFTCYGQRTFSVIHRYKSEQVKIRDYCHIQARPYQKTLALTRAVHLYAIYTSYGALKPIAAIIGENRVNYHDDITVYMSGIHFAAG